MPQTLRSMLACPFEATAVYAMTVTDDQGINRTVNINPTGATRIFRTYLAKRTGGTPGTNAGTEDDPDELMAHVANRLNLGGSTIWYVTLTNAGKVNIRYSGTVRPGEIAFTGGGQTVLRQLGFTSLAQLDGTEPTQDDQDGQYQPNHTLFAVSRPDDTGWSPRPPTRGGTEAENGSVDVLSSGIDGATRAFRLKAHAKDNAVKTLRSYLTTPMYSPPTEWTTLATTSIGLVPSSWSVQRFMMHAAGRRCGALFGNFPLLFGGSPPSTFDEFFFSLDTVRNRDPVRPTQMYNDELWDWNGIKINFRAGGGAF